jgi:hypothetical protein
MTPDPLRPTLLALAILIAMPGVGLAQDERWQIGSSPGFTSGRYGTDTRTEVVYTPFMARRLFADGDLTFVVPFTCIRGNGSVTVVDGLPVRTDATTTGDAPRPRPGRGSDAAPVFRPVLSTRATTCGLGDVIVRGRYYVLDERAWWPTVAVRAHLKAPTASADRGLGTGRPDEGLGLEITRGVGGGAMLMLDGGYTLIGKPAGIDFGNSWWYDVGVGRNFAGGVVNLSVFFEEYSAIVPGLPTARDALAALSLRNGPWRLQLSGQVGLSDTAPDHGFAIGASRRF